MSDSVPFLYYTSRGLVSYTPAQTCVVDPNQIDRLPDPPCQPRQRRPHSIHITRFAAGFVPHDLRPHPVKPPKKDSKYRVELRKLASRENAKRVLGSVFSPFSSNTSPASPSASNSTRPVSAELVRSSRSSLIATPAVRPPADVHSVLAETPTNPAVAYPEMSRPPLSTNPNGNSRPSSINLSAIMPKQPNQELDKPVCSGNGVSCSIILAEPVIFLTGLDHDGTTRDSGSNTSAILRGRLQLNITKSVKIKAVTLTFTGKARTEWPEGRALNSPKSSRLPCPNNV